MSRELCFPNVSGLLTGFRKIRTGRPGRTDVPPHFCDDRLKVDGDTTVCECCGQTFVEDSEATEKERDCPPRRITALRESPVRSKSNATTIRDWPQSERPFCVAGVEIRSQEEFESVMGELTALSERWR